MVPAKFKVGCLDYEVECTDEPLYLNGRETVGIINYRDCVIQISKNQSQQMMNILCGMKLYMQY